MCTWCSTEIQRQFCRGDDQEEHEPQAAREVSVSGQGVLGSRRHLVNRLLCVHSWDYRRDHQAVPGSPRKEDAGQAQLEF